MSNVSNESEYLSALRRFTVDKQTAIRQYTGSELVLDDWLRNGLGWLEFEDAWYFEEIQLWQRKMNVIAFEKGDFARLRRIVHQLNESDILFLDTDKRDYILSLFTLSRVSF
jgi:hypothetical protein